MRSREKNSPDKDLSEDSGVLIFIKKIRSVLHEIGVLILIESRFII